MSDCIEFEFKEAYKWWLEAPVELGKIHTDRMATQNVDNPIFQTFIDVPEELQSARHKAWKKYVIARNRLLDFYCSHRVL